MSSPRGVHLNVSILGLSSRLNARSPPPCTETDEGDFLPVCARK